MSRTASRLSSSTSTSTRPDASHIAASNTATSPGVERSSRYRTRLEIARGRSPWILTVPIESGTSSWALRSSHGTSACAPAIAMSTSAGCSGKASRSPANRASSSSSRSASRWPSPMRRRLSHRGPNARNGAAVVTDAGSSASLARRARAPRSTGGAVSITVPMRARACSRHDALAFGRLSTDTRPSVVSRRTRISLRPALRHDERVDELHVAQCRRSRCAPTVGRPGRPARGTPCPVPSAVHPARDARRAASGSPAQCCRGMPAPARSGAPGGRAVDAPSVRP